MDKTPPIAPLLAALCLALPGAALADRWRDDRPGSEYRESFRDGPCTVKREFKPDGGYKETRECRGGREGPYRHARGDFEERFRDGPCRIEREWRRDGRYTEKIECKGDRRAKRHQQATVVIAQPPWIVVEGGGPVYRPGWEPPPSKAPSGSIIRCNRDVVGGVIGGVVGGLLGSQIGKGSGRTAATIGGAIVGALIGGAIGREMDAQDQACVAHALEFAETGQRVTWRDPASGRDYAVTPGRVEFRPDGRYCRAYETEMVVGSERRTLQGQACREPDGLWAPAD